MLCSKELSSCSTTIICFYGGWVFLHGVWGNLHSKIGMMTLVALAITVAFVYSVVVVIVSIDTVPLHVWLTWYIPLDTPADWRI